jgi:hypothetical protein
MSPSSRALKKAESALARPIPARRARPSPEARWSALCIGGVLATVGACCGVNYWVDLYRVFGRDDGRARFVLSNERSGKYLLSLRYVPERFNGLLIGSSITDNWDTSRITSIRMYNGSINGGNISEAKLVADNVLDHRNLRVVAFCINPYLTQTHGRKGSGMDEQEFRSALGSLHLLRDYAALFLIQRGLQRKRWSDYGVYDFEIEKQTRLAWEEGRKRAHPETLVLDPVAYAEFGELVRRARSQGATVIRVSPPIHYDRWLLNRAEFEKYFTRMAAPFRPEDVSIDFNAPEFDTWRKRRDTFSDGVHLTREGAASVMSIMNRSIRLR